MMIIYAHFKCVFYTNLFYCVPCVPNDPFVSTFTNTLLNQYYLIDRVNNEEHFLLMLKMNKDCNLCIDHC